MERKDGKETTDFLRKKLEDIEKKMATKDDLKKFATKDDLKKFATKDDLKKFATKDDLKKFATKDDLADIREDMKKFATRDDLADIREDMKKFATRDDLADIREDMKKFATRDDLADVVVMLKGSIEDSKRYAGILQEETNHKIDILIEGFQMFNDRFERNGADNEAKFKRLDAQHLENKAAISSIDKRVSRLERKSA